MINGTAEHDMMLNGPVIKHMMRNRLTINGMMVHHMMVNRVMIDGVMINRMMGGGVDDHMPRGFGGGGGLSRMGGEKACGATD